MELTELQKDAIIELINIAFGRATASLSDLTGRRVIISAPKIDVRPIQELNRIFGSITTGEVATVHQIFSGTIAGNALLLLDYEGAVALVNLLSSERVPSERLGTSDREVLTEVGNILLNACLGTFGNILQVHISFSVPRIHIDALSALLHSLTIDTEELQYALVVTTSFRLRDSTVGGYLVMVFGVASLENLISAVERLG